MGCCNEKSATAPSPTHEPAQPPPTRDDPIKIEEPLEKHSEIKEELRKPVKAFAPAPAAAPAPSLSVTQDIQPNTSIMQTPVKNQKSSAKYETKEIKELPSPAIPPPVLPSPAIPSSEKPKSQQKNICNSKDTLPQFNQLAKDKSVIKPLTLSHTDQKPSPAFLVLVLKTNPVVIKILTKDFGIF